MINFEMELVSENPSWISVLQAYQAAQAELAAQQAEAAAQAAEAEKTTPDAGNLKSDHDKADEEVSDRDDEPSDISPTEDKDKSSSTKRASRWVERITKLPDIEPEELSKIHGRLIAYDLLKCDLTSRSAGMVYQLTSAGKEAIRRFENDDVAEAA